MPLRQRQEVQEVLRKGGCLTETPMIRGHQLIGSGSGMRQLAGTKRGTGGLTRDVI